MNIPILINNIYNAFSIPRCISGGINFDTSHQLCMITGDDYFPMCSFY